MRRAGVFAKSPSTSTSVPRGRAAGSSARLAAVVDDQPHRLARGRGAVGGRQRQLRDRGDRGQRLAAEADRTRPSPGRRPRRSWRSRAAPARAARPRPTCPSRRRAPGSARLPRRPPRSRSRRARVERVLDQFFDGRSRLLDHLARRDAVDDRALQPVNARHARSLLRSSSHAPLATFPRARRSLRSRHLSPVVRFARDNLETSDRRRAPKRSGDDEQDPAMHCGWRSSRPRRSGRRTGRTTIRTALPATSRASSITARSIRSTSTTDSSRCRSRSGRRIRSARGSSSSSCWPTTPRSTTSASRSCRARTSPTSR